MPRQPVWQTNHDILKETRTMFTETIEEPDKKPGKLEDYVFRKPEASDGANVHELVARSKPLLPNSTYCNLLQCTHFADTCVVAETDDGKLAGWTSAYILPKQPNVLFVWQIAVDESARGKGLARKMLAELLNRDACEDVQFIETTVTPENDAAWKMFSRFAYRRRWKTEEFILFDGRIHFSGEHTDEHLLRIGPFNRDQVDEVLDS